MAGNSLIKDAYQLAFQLSPILLTGGAISSMPLPAVPIIAILQGLALGVNVIGSVLGSPTTSNFLDQPAVANFRPLPGSNIISNQVASYPFASQAIAANATLTTPLTVALLMVIPAQTNGGMLAKTAIMAALQATLAAHINTGGLFTVMTPSYIYEGCILLDIKDSSPSSQAQVQTEWVWTFQRPLTQPEGLTNTLNNLMSKLQGNLPSDNLWSSMSTSIGNGISSVQSELSNLF